MSISVKDMYHGAALIQIAEYPTFKAINSFEPVEGQKSRAAFSVNHDTGIYLKYGSNPNRAFKEYSFVFNKANFDELRALRTRYGARVFVVLVCVKGKEICILKLDELDQKRAEREQEKGTPEAQYQLLVAVRPRQSFRVYMNAPGVRKTALTKTMVSRNEFPGVIFQASA
jgi:hypothetical protein